MEIIFIQLAVLMVAAFLVSFIIRLFRQPIIIGYIIAGILISPFIFFTAPHEIIELFSQFGIAFLLFIVGLHLNPKIIKEIGLSALVVGIGQIILTFSLSFLIASKLMGFNSITSLYIGAALTFSSTIIVAKFLSDKRKLDSLFGKISIGILILQDMVAILVLMLISSPLKDSTISTLATSSIAKGGVLIILLFLISYAFMRKFTHKIARSQELLFLFSLSWFFLISAFFNYLGFTIEIGALIAGVTLSISPFSLEISSKIRPLRDFFLIIFFIILGLNIPTSNIGPILRDAIFLSLVVVTLKPIIIMTLMATLSYTKRTNFLTGAILSQISEFSLIILALGVKVGHIEQRVLAMITLTGIITIAFSTYLIMYSEKIYNRIPFVIRIFERKKVRRIKEARKERDILLFGYNRIGFSLLKSLKKIKKSYLVIDFNPETIKELKKKRIDCIYGDAYDAEFLDELYLDKAKMVISTIPDFETNKLLIKHTREVNPKAIMIVIAHDIKDAFDLYAEGATYVLTPHFLGAEYVSKMIEHAKTNKEKYQKEKEKHMRRLRERKKEGHQHPSKPEVP